MPLPILYSLKHCPFAMRARLAIVKSQQIVELRNVKLTNKPAAMLHASAKGSVPILVVSPTHIIDESLDIMVWILEQNDPNNLLRKFSAECSPNIGIQRISRPHLLAFITQYDDEFKGCLEQYKCAKRYHESNLEECRQACELFVQDLELRLSENDYVMGEQESLADIAIFPFIRQFSKVERQWFVKSDYHQVKNWLNRYLQSALFNKVMAEYSLWQEGDPVTILNVQ